MMTSIRKMQQQGGAIPRWALATGDTGSMIGTPADILIAETYLKGIPVTDVEELYDELYAHATGPVELGGRGCMEEYLDAGYMAFDTECRAPTSSTLEYAHHDFAVAQLADALGHDSDADELYAQAGNWANLFDPETGFFRGKTTDGEWKEPFDPGDFADDYTEANAWHYRFHVPHDAAGLAEAFGSAEAMIEAMDETFGLASGYDDQDLPNLYYWQGNEPSIHAVWMFAELGRPDLAQKWSRWILDETYSTDAGGLAGNDDCGTLSAWYVFAALGFYPLMATDVYLVGSPVYEQAVLRLPAGDLTVTAQGAGADNVYVQSVELNGVALDEPWFRHADIADGGTLAFVMGPQPSSWGVE
jgi:predicted alpha-1,2-mannosidase